MVPTEATTRTEIVFETQRLLIRRFKPTDLQDAYEIYSDPEVAKYEFWDPFTLEETREDLILQGAVLPGTYEVWNEFAVQLRDEGKLIGNISFHTSEPEQKQAEIGFHFNRAYHGRGYGKEAVTGLINYVWTIGIHRVWAVSDTRNPNSWKMMEKLGMRREGHLVQNCFIKGEWADEYLYALLRVDWQKAQSTN